MPHKPRVQIRGPQEYSELIDGATRSLDTNKDMARLISGSIENETVEPGRMREYRRDLVNLKRSRMAVQQQMLTWRAEILSDSLRASGDERETLQGLIGRIDAIVLDDAA